MRYRIPLIPYHEFFCPFSISPIPEPETYALLPTGLDLTGVRAASATPA